MHWRNKKVGLSLLASVMLLSSLLGYQLALSSVPAAGPWGGPLVPFGTASYYVSKFDNGTTYMVDGDTWRCTWWDSDSDAIINAALGNLTSGRTWKEKVVLMGSFTIDAPLTLDNFTLLDLYDAKITLADNSDCNMIENADQITIGNTEIEICGGILEGNKANQASGSIINFTNPTLIDNPYRYVLTMYDSQLLSAKDDGIYLSAESGGQRAFLHDLVIGTGGNFPEGRALYMEQIHDSQFSNIYVQSWKTQLYLQYCSGNDWNNIYVAGTSGGSTLSPRCAIYVYGGRCNDFIGVRNDNMRAHGWRFVGDNSDYNNIIGGHTTLIGESENDTWSGVRFENDTVYNTVQGHFIGRHSAATTLCKYGIEEVGTTDHNVFIGVTVKEPGTAGIIVVGADTKVNLCWNGTSWIS